MLRVTVELLPGGVEDDPKKLGELFITNVDSYGLGFANYEVRTHRGGDVKCMVMCHKRDDGFWHLVKDALALYLLSRR